MEPSAATTPTQGQPQVNAANEDAAQSDAEAFQDAVSKIGSLGMQVALDELMKLASEEE
jgi:hypothetical protein